MAIQREIKSYKSGDEQKIVGIYNSAFGSDFPFFYRTEESWLWRYVNRPLFEPNSILIAEEDGKAVASVVMTYANLMIEGVPRSFALVDDVATLPEYRNKGYATALMERAVEIAEEKQCYAIHLVADPDGPASRIYEKIGFSTITKLDFMQSPLRIYELAKAVGVRYYIPLLFLNSWMRLKEHRNNNRKFVINVVSGRELLKALVTNQENYNIRNGSIEIDDDYATWMIEKRPTGKMMGITATKDDEAIGMMTVSAHEMKTRSGTFQIGNIANIAGTHEFWTEEVLWGLLQTTREVAKETLNCSLASIAVDERDTKLKNACIHSRFHQLRHGAAMIHPLANSDKLREIKSSIWSQPLETMVADP